VEKIRLEIVALSSSQSQSGAFALVLGEENGNRSLPIIIGMFEAQAIAIEIEKVQPNRPMTHDLFRSFANAFQFQVEEVIISDLKEGVFFAKIVCSDGIKKVDIDARPSDAIAIGLRFGVPFYTYENVLSEAGIIRQDEDNPEIEDPANRERKRELNPTTAAASKQSAPSQSFDEQLKKMNVDQLQLMLTDALDKEDYERAAKVRDELNKRN
jgi:bifunctional DNase/RNase